MVDFFFVLSGFVLAKAFWSPIRAVSPMRNIWQRVARLYPLHLFTLCIVAALQWWLVHRLHGEPFVYAGNTARNFGLNLLLLQQSGLQHGFSFNAPSWSISTEFLINLVFLMLIAAPRYLGRLGIVLLWIAALVGVAQFDIVGIARPFGWIDHELPRTCAGFLTGVMTYRLYAHFNGRSCSPMLGDALSLLLILIVATYLAESTLWSPVSDIFICLLAFPVTVLTVLGSGKFSDCLRWRPLIRMGENSYSIYLMHFPLLLTVHVLSLATNTTFPFGSTLFFLIFMLVLVLVASMTHQWIEQPGRRWMTDLFNSKRHAATSH